MDQRPFLRVQNVSHTFPDGVTAIANVSLTVPVGAFVALVGSSGVGKSTLLRVLAGLLQPTAGRVLLNDHAPSAAPDPIGIVFQRDNLMPWRTVQANIRLPLELQGVDGRVAEHRVQAMIDLVGLSGFEESFPAQLSGGMAQRVAIARALVHEPSLLLLDEPFGALDALTRERMGQELLRIWKAMPVTVVMVTHSIPEAVLLADEVLVMASQPGVPGPAGTISKRLPIALPRPRTLAVQRTDAFQDYAAAIRAAIGADAPALGR
ncbi:MAG: ABC transporter ATP-binding protein [Candidatus Promineifilaceae bacterium]|nr:ABC transporter ATP-binding protein [Candidatus Promineifilaceae bacterium]